MVDYALYLVTDSTPAILADKDICDVVKRALQGGVTIVQYRDKTNDTAVLVSMARKLLAITRSFNVPLLINDRVDVALAIGCEGVHIGQDDMNIDEARKLLGPDRIIGVTTSTVDEAIQACKQGANYLGIGTVFATSTKQNTKQIIGPDGLRHILEVLSERGFGDISTVCIGGINASNVRKVMFHGSSPKKQLDGVAVVSAIMAAEDPEAQSRRLLDLVRKPLPFGKHVDMAVEDPKKLVPKIVKAVHDQKPLSHNMTNLVVQNFAANVALAVGASPIMANYGEEAADLAKLGGALVINMGTVTPEGLENYLKALRAYNAAGQPVVFDPVGAGATAVRRAATKTIMSAGYIDVIKGNESEIKTVWGEGETESQRGVDSSSSLSFEQKVKLVSDLATRESGIVVMTGKTDLVSDGRQTFAVDNGHEYLGLITGTGCTLGTTISAMVTAHPEDRLAAAISGLVMFEIAAERAATRPEVRGPGTFTPAFLDELYRVRIENADGNLEWLKNSKVYVADRKCS